MMVKMRLKNQLINADAFSILPKMKSESVDLIFTDPPYSKSLVELYKEWNQDLDYHVLGWHFHRLLKKNGQVCLFADFITAVDIANAFEKWFKFRFYWIWQKYLGQPVGGRLQPINDTELILVFRKKKSRRRDMTFNYADIRTEGQPYSRYYQGKNLTRKKQNPYLTMNESGCRYPKTVLRYPSKCNMPANERSSHPTQKPLNLCELIVKALSNPGELVLDPFAGSGTIPLACSRLNRNWIGIEINHDYYHETLERMHGIL